MYVHYNGMNMRFVSEAMAWHGNGLAFAYRKKA